MKRTLIAAAFGAAGLAGLLAPRLSAETVFKPAVLLDARGNFESESAGGGGVQDGAGNGQLLLVPGFTFGTGTSLLPVMGLVATDRSASIPEDTFLVQSYNFFGRPQIRQALGESWNLDLWGSAKHSYNLESASEALGTGLYDYEEFGGGLGLEWAHRGDWLSKTELGLELAHRHYTNWFEKETSLIGDKNYYDKDYEGPKLTWSFAGPEAPSTWSLELDWQHKAYTDALLLGSDGVFLPATERLDDWFHAEGAAQKAWGVWTLALNASADDYISNMGFFDQAAQTPQWVPDFYGYRSYQAGPTLTWHSLGTPGAYVSASASWLLRDYTGRLVRNFDSTYAQGLQEDVEQHYGIDALWPIWRGMALVGGANDTVVQSNQEYAFQYQPSYSLLSVNLGLHYQY